MRIGIGYDVHQLAEGRDLIIGGVTIQNDKGLVGHSDADVLIHAVMDAIIGALGLGDIGKHFSDTDERYKGADSMQLLAQIYTLMTDYSYSIGNIDSIIVAQSPKMAPYIEEMKENIAQTLHMSKEDVNIKATTEEKLGFTGRKEGIASYASVLLQSAKG